MSDLSKLGESREPDIRGDICMRDLGLKYYHLSREKLEPIGAHNFTADGIISATLYNVSNNTAKQIYCIKMILSFSLINCCETSSFSSLPGEM